MMLIKSSDWYPETSLLSGDEKVPTMSYYLIFFFTAYDLEQGLDRVKILVTLTGPFLQDSLRNTTSKINTLNIWLHRSIVIDGEEMYTDVSIHTTYILLIKLKGGDSCSSGGKFESVQIC